MADTANKSRKRQRRINKRSIRLRKKKERRRDDIKHSMSYALYQLRFRREQFEKDMVRERNLLRGCDPSVIRHYHLVCLNELDREEREIIRDAQNGIRRKFIEPGPLVYRFRQIFDHSSTLIDEHFYCKYDEENDYPEAISGYPSQPLSNNAPRASQFIIDMIWNGDM